MGSHDTSVSFIDQRKGYAIEYIAEDERFSVVQQGLVCSVCDGILRSAVQVSCGGRFCQKCHQDLCKIQDAICPCERDKSNNVTQHRVPNACQPDNFCRKRIRGLRAQCINISIGCSWMGQLVDCEEHLNVCPFRNAMRCHCGEIFQNTTEHRQHKDNGCPQSSGAEAAPRACSSCEHPEVQSGLHIEKLCSGLQQLQTQLALLSPGKIGQQYQMMSKPVPPNDTKDGTRSENAISQSHYEALLNKYKSNTSLITVLFNEVKTCSYKLQQSTSKPEDVDNLERRLSELEKLVQNIQETYLRVERPIHDVQVIDTSSRLTWRLENISQKIKDAMSGVAPALYSKPFLSNDAGYKMCARLYPNGDGIGKGSHVSLFFVLMKGPYDPILPWPFKHHVTMQLLDQSGQGSHIHEKFRADPNSSSFQQPRSEMNVATGCPRFISLNELERRKGVFMKDNTMFIRINVE